MAVKGAVLGDILGAQFEFDRPKNLDWNNVPLAEGDAIGFTDDTVMTLAIKKALKTGADLVETMVEVGREYPFAGYGGRVLRRIRKRGCGGTSEEISDSGAVGDTEYVIA